MSKKYLIIITIILVILVGSLFLFINLYHNHQIKNNTSNIITNNTKLIITIDEVKINATLIDNPSTKEFINLLPVTIDLDNQKSRDKYANILKKLDEFQIASQKLGKIQGDIYIVYSNSSNTYTFYHTSNQNMSSDYTPIAKIDNVNQINEINSGSIHNISMNISY